MRKLCSMSALAVISASALLAVGCSANGDHPYGLTGAQTSNPRFIGNGPHGQPMMLPLPPEHVATPSEPSEPSGPNEVPSFKGFGPHGQPL